MNSTLPSLSPKSLVSPRRYLRLVSWSCLAAGLAGVGWFQFSGSEEGGSLLPASIPPHQASAHPTDILQIGHESAAESPGLVVYAAASNPEESAPEGSEERRRRSIAGEWEDEYRGKRHLAVSADGTAKMVVEPEGIGKKLFADRLTFDIEWRLADGRVTMKMLRGEPKSKVKLILKLYGEEAEYKILDLTDDRMLLLDPDGTTQYDWRRPGAVAAGPE